MGPEITNIGNAFSKYGRSLAQVNQMKFRATTQEHRAQSIMDRATISVRNLNNQLNQNLDQIARNIRKGSGSLRANQARSGFDIGSKSSLMVRADFVNQMEVQAGNMRQNVKLQQQQIYYDAQIGAQEQLNAALLTRTQARSTHLQAQGSLVGDLSKTMMSFTRSLDGRV